MTSVVFLHQILGMHVFEGFPRVVQRWIPLPFDQVLELAFVPIVPVVNDGFDFIFLGVLDQVWWWAFEIGAMSGCFFVGQQERCVEDVVDSP